eukprot:s7415_g1.t1
MDSNVGTAHDPLLPLTRWIQYTQTELQSVRADLIHHREEELAVRRLQQSQLDSLQVQIRELAQQQTEFSEQMTEVANAVTGMFHQLGVLRNTFNHAMNDMLRHFKSPQQNHKGCAHFSYWKDGGCLLTSSGAHSVKHHGVVSGAGSCSGGASYEGAPTGAYTGPSVMTVKNRGGMPPPKGVQQYNGIAWPTMKIGEKKAVYHMFAIGDWGALIGTNPGRMIQYRSGQTGGPHTMARWRGPCTTDQMASCMGGGQCPSDCHFEHDADYRAQVNVANTMRKFAADRNPDLFINVGDNFYWGGINTYCGTPMHKIDPVTAHQFREIFEMLIWHIAT